MADSFEVEILPDGSVKVTTDKISQPNHSSADGLLSALARLLGGSVIRKRRGQSHVHTHEGVRHEH